MKNIFITLTKLHQTQLKFTQERLILSEKITENNVKTKFMKNIETYKKLFFLPIIFMAVIPSRNS